MKNMIQQKPWHFAPQQKYPFRFACAVKFGKRHAPQGTSDPTRVTCKRCVRKVQQLFDAQRAALPGFTTPTLRSAAAAVLGRKGGSVTSPAKVAAARANGRKGGRPVFTED